MKRPDLKRPAALGHRLSAVSGKLRAESREPTAPSGLVDLWTCGLALAVLLALSTAARAETFLLVHDDLSIQTVDLRSIENERVMYVDPMTGRMIERTFDECLALMRRNASMEEPRHAGWLTLADGQRFPGRLIAELETAADAAADMIVWEHGSFGTIVVPLDAVDSVQLDPEASMPDAGANDIVLLSNGDVLEGFVIELGEEIVIEMERDGEVDLLNINHRHVAAINMVTPAQPSLGRRLWLRDGTVMDVSELRWPDEDRAAVVVVTQWAEGTQRTEVRASRIAAISLDTARLLPLASITPRRIDGPDIRYEIPAPTLLDTQALLSLASLEMRGPLTVRYALPRGASRFAAELHIPPAARPWIDSEIVIRADEIEIHRRQLRGHEPQMTLNVPLHGRELSIEITDGRYGSIHNQVQLRRPRLLIER